MLRKTTLLSVLFICSLFFANASAPVNSESHSETEKSKSYDPVPMIMHHIADAHEIHFWGEGENSFSIPLTVILFDNGLHFFSSSKFHHGHDLVESNENKYMYFHGKIYSVGDSIPIDKQNKTKVIDRKTGKEKDTTIVERVATIPTKDFIHDYIVGHKHLEDGAYVASAKPMDFSITKSVVGIFVTFLILFLVFTSVAKSYRSNGGIPKKLTGWMEPLVIFIRDDVAKANIGEAKYKKFVPFLLSIFFFILVLNILGLTPLGFNVTGNIAVTLVLALISLFVTLKSANKNYWMHIFWPPVPLALKPLMIPIEIVGIFTKPFALMIRLFANITAGHIVILSLISLIFVAQAGSGTGMAWGVSPAAFALTLFIFVLEVLVAFLQAYIFTLLTALFVGMSVEEHH